MTAARVTGRRLGRQSSVFTPGEPSSPLPTDTWEYERRDGKREEKGPCCSPHWRTTKRETKALINDKGSKKGWREYSLRVCPGENRRNKELTRRGKRKWRWRKGVSEGQGHPGIVIRPEDSISRR